MLDIEKIRERRNNSDRNDMEEYRISNGCCLFHDIEEFDQFIDTDDDSPEDPDDFSEDSE